MESIWINLDFKKSRMGKFVTFCQTVVTRGTADPKRYAGIQAQLAVVSASLAALNLAISDAANRDKAKVTIRNNKLKIVKNDMTLLAKITEIECKGDGVYVTDLTFDLRRKGSNSSGDPLETPSIETLVRGVLSGTVEGKTTKFPKGAKQLAIEYSADNGKTWINGTYSSNRKFTLKGLPTKQEVLVRCMLTGTFQRKSNWSESKSVFVL